MKQSVKAIIIFLIIIWSSYFLSGVYPLTQFGIVPRTVPGLAGVVFAPMLHGSFSHLVNNSIGFVIFAVILALLEGNKMFAKVMLMVIMGGMLTWLLGRNANHIGASGLIFSLFGYMLLAGWFSKKIKYILVSICLIFFYSGMLLEVLPGAAEVSWESHLFGFIAGIIVARVYHR